MLALLAHIVTASRLIVGLAALLALGVEVCDAHLVPNPRPGAEACATVRPDVAPPRFHHPPGRMLGDVNVGLPAVSCTLTLWRPGLWACRHHVGSTVRRVCLRQPAPPRAPPATP